MKRKKIRFLVKRDEWVAKTTWTHSKHRTLRIEMASDGVYIAVDYTSQGVILLGKEYSLEKAKRLFQPILAINGAGSIKHHFQLRTGLHQEPVKSTPKPKRRRRLILRR